MFWSLHPVQPFIDLVIETLFFFSIEMAVFFTLQGLAGRAQRRLAERGKRTRSHGTPATI